MNKYLFVINPVSGGLGKEALIEKINHFCLTKSYSFHTYLTTGLDDKIQIKRTIEDQKPDVIVVSGGDGTINMVVPLILDFNLTLGIIPAGSANGLATELGITPENAFETLENETCRPMDIILLNEDKYMIHLADFGLNAMLVRRYEEEGRRGLLGYAISALKEIGTLEEPFEVTVETGDTRNTYMTKFLIIANATKYGTGFQVNPDGELGDQKVELCFLKEISPSLVFDHLLGDDSKKQSNNFFEVLSSKHFSIKLNEPIDFQSDGEYIGKANSLDIQVIDQQISVIAPG